MAITYCVMSKIGLDQIAVVSTTYLALSIEDIVDFS